MIGGDKPGVIEHVGGGKKENERNAEHKRKNIDREKKKGVEAKKRREGLNSKKKEGDL